MGQKKLESQLGTTFTLQRVIPRTISSISNSVNENAIDWGWQGFLAYGVQTSIVIVDTTTIQVVQTLCHHKGYIIKIKWRNTEHYHSMSAPYNLILAASDTTGCINVWDITKGEIISTLTDGNKPMTEMAWLGNLDGSEYLLATLQPPYSFALWDTLSGTRIWKKSFTDHISSFQLDPFNQSHVAFHGKNILLFVYDFNTVKCTQTNGQRYFIYEPTTPGGNREENGSQVCQTILRSISPGDKLRSEDFTKMQECKSILFHRSMDNVLLLVYSKEILILDLLVKLVIGTIQLDRPLSLLNQVISCWQSDVIYCLHEFGATSAYFRHRRKNDENEQRVVEYKRVCSSEPIRHGKMKDLSAFAINPVTEKQFAGVLSNIDPVVIFTELRQASTGRPGAIDLSPLFDKVPQMFLSQLAPCLNKESPERGALRISMSGVLPFVQAASTIRMCPPLTTKNINSYLPLVATANTSGEVQIINVATGLLEKTFHIHTCIVRGIEWTSLESLLSYGYQELTSANGLVRNELIHTNILTGCNVKLRSQAREESVIEILKVSYLKNYFIIVFANSPFELWDCITLTLLRTISIKFPKMSALEWAPSSFVSRYPGKESDPSKDMSQENLTPQDTSTVCADSEVAVILAKESMVFSDVHGQLFLFSVQGNMIKDGTKFPSHTQRYSTTSIAWKGFKIVASDTDGFLSVLDLKTKLFRQIGTHRGYIKRLKFAPGKDNMKLIILFKDGVDIWDLEKLDMVSQLLARNVHYTTKENCEIIDADWAASDSPMFLYTDGAIRIFDIHLKGCHSPLGHYIQKDFVASPYLMNPGAALNLRTLMTHQPHKEHYSLNFTIMDGFTEEQLYAIKYWLQQLPKGVCQFMEECNDVCIRAVMTAYLFGDKGEIDFWTVAAVYLNNFSKRIGDVAEKQNYFTLFPSVRSSFLNLGPSYYQLCTNSYYKEISIERFTIQLAMNLSSPLRDSLVNKFAWIGELDRAIKLLLETDFADMRFHADCLRACMMSANHESNQAQSTIKLVATNLIAAGRVFEGTELLCLIDKKVDACRYLQSHGFMTESIWVAKCNNFDNEEILETTKKWVQHLIKEKNKGKAVLAYLSSGLFSVSMDLLIKQNYSQRAAIFLDAIHSSGVSKGPNAIQATIVPHVEQSIYREYILFLHEIHSTKALEYYATNVIESDGPQLLSELQKSNSL